MGMQFFKGFSAYEMVYYKLSYTEGQEKLYYHQFKNIFELYIQIWSIVPSSSLV